jgi:arylsulfatase A-like enzyme
MAAARPNILVILTDEERYPPVYENDDLRSFRRAHLPGQNSLRARGTEFHRHYTASTACSPSRASLFTGQYPTLHGVRATDGAAKAASDPNMFWLDPNTVPTLGHWLRAGGYRTHYRGKWHISHADLVAPDTHAPIASNDVAGAPLEPSTSLYRAAERLDVHGFRGWIGPDPHGTAQTNCGRVRDPMYGDQLDALFTDLEAGDGAPWLTVASFVNPHDIVLFGLLWRSWGYDFDDDTVPDVPPPPTERESLRSKPGCQADYVEKYGQVFLPQPQIPLYRRFYYYLHKLVDLQVARLLARLDASRFRDDTIVVYSSDHGDMLGAHGGMHQKWHNAYDECIRVPLLLAGPGIPAGGRVDHLSSHVDLLPTLLGLADLDPAALARELSARHGEARAPVGRDLSALARGGALADEPVYFMTEDEVSEGLDQTTAIGRPYEAVAEPAKVEAVLARLDLGDGPRLYKSARAYRDSQIGDPADAPRREGPSEDELYDLDADPLETDNLAHGLQGRGARALVQRMADLLADVRARKALHPRLR